MMDQGSSWQLDGETLVVQVPMRLARRGGRKAIVAPAGADAWVPPTPEPDAALLRALGRAYRWKRLLDEGVHASIGDLARAEKVDYSYVSRVLLLSLLAPNIIEAALDGSLSVQLADILRPLPTQWSAQHETLTAKT